MKNCKLCDGPVLARNYCRKHYLRWYKHGDPSIVYRKTGQPSKDKDGYLIQWINGKCLKVHRVIMEQHLGRKLSNTEHLHHINGINDDNRIENLEIISIKKHGSISSKKRWKDHKPRICLKCNRKASARHLCSRHYYYAKKNNKLPPLLRIGYV